MSAAGTLTRWTAVAPGDSIAGRRSLLVPAPRPMPRSRLPRWTLLALGCGGLLSSRHAAAQQPVTLATPIMYRGILIGAPFVAVRRTLPVECRRPDRIDGATAADSVCSVSPALSYAGVAPQAVLIDQWNGQMAQVRVILGTDDFEAVRVALIGKFGAPSVTVVDTVQTKAGAFFRRETLQWKRNGATLVARPYAGKTLDAAAVVLSSDAYEAALRQAEAADLRRRIADM